MKYKTNAGDTWDGISFLIWGNDLLIVPLMNANIEHIQMVIFPSGIELTIPELSTIQTDELPPWKREE